MSVEFEEDNIGQYGRNFSRPNFEKPPSFLVALVLRMGFAKNKEAANYVLLGAACLFFIVTVSLYIYISSIGKPSGTAPKNLPPKFMRSASSL